MRTQKPNYSVFEKTAFCMSKQDLNVPPRLYSAKSIVEPQSYANKKIILKNPLKCGLNTCDHKSLKASKKEVYSVPIQNIILLSRQKVE